MQRENPLPFFFALLFLILLSATSDAQVHATPADSMSAAEAQARELDRIESLTRFGPHYKNPNAAGRLLTLNRAVPPLPLDYDPVRLIGPAYKHRKPDPVRADLSTRRRPANARLFGPRYKNRGAKSGNL